MQRLRVILVLSAMALMFFGLGLGFGLLLPRLIQPAGSQKFLNTAAVIRQVQSLSQLVTVSYVMEKVVDLQDVKWSEMFGASRVLLLAHGTVKAGVDLQRLGADDMLISGRSIVLSLPAAQITDASLDETQTQVLERSTGLLRSFDKNLESVARQQALDDIKRAARRGGILQEADAKAKEQLANLFRQLGFEQVEFREEIYFSPPPG